MALPFIRGFSDLDFALI